MAKNISFVVWEGGFILKTGGFVQKKKKGGYESHLP